MSETHEQGWASNNLDNTRKGICYGVNGAMTRFVRVPASMLTNGPGKSFPFEEACLTEPMLTVAYNAVVGKTLPCQPKSDRVNRDWSGKQSEFFVLRLPKFGV